MRTDLILRSFKTRVPSILPVAAALFCAASLLTSGLQAADDQEQAPAQSPPAPEQSPDQNPTPSRPQRPAPLPRGKKPDVPDYPDPRTFTLGAYVFAPVPGTGPDLQNGKESNYTGRLYGLGKEHLGPGVFISIPVSRATEIRFEGFRTKGAGNQTLTADQVFFGTQFYNKDFLSNSYRITSGKIWVDDLFWPHRYPVSKFRVKAIYGVRFLQVKAVVDAPLGAVSGSTVVGYSGQGSKQVIQPAIGLAPEYALSKHIL